jgi:hypothetical protein
LRKYIRLRQQTNKNNKKQSLAQLPHYRENENKQKQKTNKGAI